MPILSSARSVLTRGAIARMAVGWGSFLALSAAAPLLAGRLSILAIGLVLAGIVAAIIISASGVVEQAEHLASRLGDPYGTLVLTLSIVLIEVILISAVMLGPGDHQSIARDSVMAVSMIILNLVIGACLLVGALRRRTLRMRRTGISTYLTMLIVLSLVAFAMPGMIGAGGAYRPGQAALIALLVATLYAGFLLQQTGPAREDFQEVGEGPDEAQERPQRQESSPILPRVAVLVVTVLPIVLLSHDMAELLDEGLGRIGAPVALSGILIAMIVFLPETLTALRAARAGEMQRVSNLCHGALVSTLGLTIPAVLVIGLLTGQDVRLAESGTNLMLLGASVLLTLADAGSRRLTPMHGAGHLLLFVLYGMSVLA